LLLLLGFFFYKIYYGGDCPFFSPEDGSEGYIASSTSFYAAVSIPFKCDILQAAEQEEFAANMRIFPTVQFFILPQ